MRIAIYELDAHFDIAEITILLSDDYFVSILLLLLLLSHEAAADVLFDLVCDLTVENDEFIGYFFFYENTHFEEMQEYFTEINTDLSGQFTLN